MHHICIFMGRAMCSVKTEWTGPKGDNLSSIKHCQWPLPAQTVYLVKCYKFDFSRLTTWNLVPNEVDKE